MSRSSVELVRTDGVVIAADAGAVVLAADGSRRLLQVGDTVHPGDLVFTGGKPLIIDFGDEPVAVASNCATCVDGASGTLIAASAETLDVDALQQAILAGVDPTLAFEAAAAGPGGGVGGSGGSSFSVITRDGAATLAEAGFDTSAIESAEPVLVSELVTAPAVSDQAPVPNTPPAASDLNVTVNEDEVLNSAIVASDLDGDALSYVLGTSPANGSVVLNTNGTFTYTPNANYNGSDSFTVTVSDGQGGVVTSTVTIGVTPVNDLPTTSDLNLTTDEDTAVNGGIVASDVDGDTLSFVLGTSPTNGSVTLNADGTFTYTPNANYNGSDSFTVTVSDDNGGTVTSTVTIGVTPVN
ncbi:MAG: retention module-containing protein, partial [Gammaproteobacteria bacterium]|nr:retention module-containing protein [Gammaproteobacteria bacterium]